MTTPILALIGVFILLITAIARFGLHPFLALLGCALLLGPVTGQSLPVTLAVIMDGFATTLKWIGIVMVLGTLIGEILHVTGGSARIAHSILRLTGKDRLPLTMSMTGYVVSIPVFVDVAYIMLLPVIESLTRASRYPILVVGLSLAAGLTASHALLPPTPGPLAGAGILGADLGRLIVLNAFVALCAVAGGLAWATLYCGRFLLPFDTRTIPPPTGSETITRMAPSQGDGRPPTGISTFGAYMPILLPLVLIAGGSFVPDQVTGFPLQLIQFLGSPVVALLIGVLSATVLLERGNRIALLGRHLDTAMTKAAVVIMITGAGGAFGAVIKSAHIGDIVAAGITNLGVPGLLLPFLLAMALTTATGSLTVSMVTSASIMVSLLPGLGISPELTVSAIGAGSLCIVHANASFFWLLSKLHDVPAPVLYRTYSVQSVCMGVSGFLGVLILWMFGVR